ncbi:methyl-accepting chemotaxis protein [Piscinibacter terrae]|uniref:Chemotaxis protein n=1 Tax=Piscinibacter terrae TaxID=2496871 RepID=A0A3N7HWS7_9BURK|nr:methyl-accepting chemotaxis protein [Albitalea terrae]RQP25491.1 chemotaxis protein [Albitalea terrae]
MFSSFKKDRPSEAKPVVEHQLSSTGEELRAAVDSIGKQASNMGREAAEVRGLMEDTQKVSARQAQTMNALAGKVQEITKAQDAISGVSKDSLNAVDRARKAVEEVGEGVNAIVATLRQVSQAAQTITKIALQTRLVAFNASVEAKRAGEAGRGFGVVADAVKDLAAKVESSSKEIMSTVGELDQRIDALSREIRVEGDDADKQGGFHRALTDVQSGVASINEAAEQSRGICADLNQQMATVEQEIHQTTRALDSAFVRSESFLKVSENLIDLVSHCGIETEDTPFINAAQEAAAQISKLLEDSLRTSTINLVDLFDEQYKSIAGTNPQQHTTKFIDLADRLFPQVQERVLAMSNKIVFCIAADRNGYIACHNKKYCNPQRGDLAWDTANSRYRRIFNDRTGLASARNQRPFLLQTYRRDMGGGNFVVMKEAAAPIVVAGRHWGGLRLAFHF